MQTNKTTTKEREFSNYAFTTDQDDNQRTQERLNKILAINQEYKRKAEIFQTEQEKLEADLMTNPLSNEKAFAYFGLLLGLFPPAAIFGKILSENGSFQRLDAFIVLFLLANIGTMLGGYFTGNFIGKIINQLNDVSIHWKILSIPLIGVLWGIISGVSGGIFIFVIGAIFGAICGGIVGAIALPIFSFFHHFLQKGEQIDGKHFYPIAFGISLAISAYILVLEINF